MGTDCMAITLGVLGGVLGATLPALSTLLFERCKEDPGGPTPKRPREFGELSSCLGSLSREGLCAGLGNRGVGLDCELDMAGGSHGLCVWGAGGGGTGC